MLGESTPQEDASADGPRGIFEIEAMGVPVTGLPFALNWCVPHFGLADLMGMVGWENMCPDSLSCSQLLLRMVGRELWDRFFCRAPRESWDERIVDSPSLSSDNDADIEGPALAPELAATAFLKK